MIPPSHSITSRIITSPGVAIAEVPALPSSIARADTAVPAFIGHTGIAAGPGGETLHLVPTRITSLGEFQALFGGAPAETGMRITLTEQPASASATGPDSRSPHIMAAALALYFANGGGPCWIISAGGFGGPGQPLPPASSAANLAAGLTALANMAQADLLVIPEAAGLPIAAYHALMDQALALCAATRRFLILDAHGGALSWADPATDVAAAAGNFRSSGIGADHLAFGAAYAPHLATSIALTADPDATLVSIAGTAPQSLRRLMATRSDLAERALAAIAALGCTLPPSAAIAGVIAATDNSFGVWKAPANVSLAAVGQPAIAITARQQDGLNIDAETGKSINAIRVFSGRGTLVWGARTLAGNDTRWRHISVRRFTSMIEASLQAGLASFSLEPNDTATWARARRCVEDFLHPLWREGALVGTKPEQAFFVHCGIGQTMTDSDQAEGRMIIAIGLAMQRPAEFDLLSLVQAMPAD